MALSNAEKRDFSPFLNCEEPEEQRHQNKAFQNAQNAEKCDISHLPNHENEQRHEITLLQSAQNAEKCFLSDLGPGKKRGAAWQEWEDRALAKQVLADDPILNKSGRKEDRWTEVAEHLTKLVKMDRSWSSCKDRIDRLVGWHRKEETKSKQKTGDDEQVNQYLQNMTDIALLFDSISQNKEVRQGAKEKLAAKKVKGKKIRDASMKGQVRMRDLLEEGDITGPGVGPAPKKAPKNQFAKQVDAVVEGLHQKAKEIRQEGIERGKKDEEKRKRDEDIKEQQMILNRNIEVLIDSQKATNEMMRDWINVFSTVRP